MLAPIKPVSCACQSAKFKDWRVGKGDYEVTPIEGNVYNVTVTLTDYNMTLTVDGQTVATTDYTINDVNSNFINLTFVNHSSSRAFFRFYEILKDGGIIDLYSIRVSVGDSIGNLVGINKSHDVAQYNVIAGSRSQHYNVKRDREDFKLSDIITSDLVTDTEDEFLNTYYANWCIVDPFDDFATELKIAFTLAEDKLRAYKAQLEDFNPSAKTVMSVAYGQRGNTDYGYRYPIGGNVETSAPNTGAKSTVDAVTDTTTVDKNEEPFKNLDKTKAMDGWLKFFVDQFRECFTIAEAMTW